MFSFPCLRLSAACLLCVVGPAGAVSDAPRSAPAAGLQYRSIFSGYRAFDEQPVAAWAGINEKVGAIGGWRSYAREASQPPGAGSDRVAPTVGDGIVPDSRRGAPGSHSGHGATK